MDNEIIIAIYVLKTIKNKGQYYFFDIVFNHEGKIEYDLMYSIYKDLPESDISENVEGMIGPFLDSIALDRYALKLCEKLGNRKICIYSIQEFNSVVMNVSNIEELKSTLPQYGNCIENLDFKKNKSFLGKIF